MKPKSKAKQLVNKFYHYVPHDLNYTSEQKECALIVVNEILDNTPLTSCPDEYIVKHGVPVGSRNWWQEVRKAIEQMK